MGEKRPYKARNPGGGRKKRKPEHNAGKKLKEQLDAAVVLYNSEMSLQAIADAGAESEFTYRCAECNNVGRFTDD